MGEDTTDDLGRIRARTLLLWGDRDAFFARNVQESLVRGLPQARLRTYAGVGHAVHWEVPARVAADIATFLERLGR
jgi:pimeloyl-ACP methyl ester carboxylesterase